MSKKNSVFDSLIAYLHSLRIEENPLGEPLMVDDLALSRVRFIEQVLQESELSPAEIERASTALNSAYSAVDPAYTGTRVYLRNFGEMLSPETQTAHREGPVVPKDIDKMQLDDSEGVSTQGTKPLNRFEKMFGLKPRTDVDSI